MTLNIKRVVLSNSYRIFETNEFIKRLSKLPPHDASFLQKKLSGYIYPHLKKEPHFGKNIKKLRGYKSGLWRYRIGKYRIFYSIHDEEKIVNIITVDFRKDIYK